MITFVLMKKMQYKLLIMAFFLVCICLGNCRPKHRTQSEPDAVTAAHQTAQQETENNDDIADSRQAEESKANIVRYELPAIGADEIILKRKGYTASYNTQTRCPNWVAWHLTKSHTYGNNQRSQENFREDYDIDFPRATLNDYYNSRYDRGHMCPAADNKWDREALAQTFILTNICPQNHGLNSHEWNDLEIKCRQWARRYGAIDIACGPIYYDNAQPRTIGRNQVRVPDAFFKVILCRQKQPKAIAFIYRNEGKKQTIDQAVCSVDHVEQLTGYDFFAALDDETENRLEADFDLADW